MFADDLHASEDISRAVSYRRALLTATAEHPERFGVVVRNPDGTLAEIVEKPSHPPSNLVSSGVMVLDDRIFLFEPERPINGEYFLTEVIERYAQEFPIAVVEEQGWVPIGYPEDIVAAEKKLCK